MSRNPNEKPLELTPDKAHFPLTCDGNGHRKPKATFAPACQLSISVGQPIITARWQTSPHLTVHCRACREHFFGANRKLPFGAKGE
jgi:hypothetical protein